MQYFGGFAVYIDRNMPQKCKKEKAICLSAKTPNGLKEPKRIAQGSPGFIRAHIIY